MVIGFIHSISFRIIDHLDEAGMTMNKIVDEPNNNWSPNFSEHFGNGEKKYSRI